MKKSLFCLFLCSFLFAVGTKAHAAVNCYMVIANIPGESTNKTYPNSIEISSEGQANSNCEPTYGAGGAGACKTTLGDFSVQMLVSKASGPLMKTMLKGTRIATIDLYYMKTTGKGEPETYYTIHLTNVSITKLSEVGSEDGSVAQQVSFSAETIAWTYRAQNPTTGALGTAVTITYDRTTNIVQ